MMQGRYRDAADVLTSLLSVDKSIAALYYNRGVARSCLGEYEGARDDLSAFIDMMVGHDIASLPWPDDVLSIAAAGATRVREACICATATWCGGRGAEGHIPGCHHHTSGVPAPVHVTCMHRITHKGNYRASKWMAVEQCDML